MELTYGVDDMVLLKDSSEQGIMQNLRERLVEGRQMYAYIGSVLIAVNPYSWLPIYDRRDMKRFINKARVDVPPHVFAVAESAFRTMLQEEESQCVIISGESGAGKTEASKQIQNYIAAVSGGPELHSSGSNSVNKIKKVFLESNPLLEAFGNAKTLRNNNSSRFGKYFVLQFNAIGHPLGGKVTNYLLEKSRVVRPGKGERNFHIFYQLLAHLQKQKLSGNSGSTSKSLAASLGLSGESIEMAECPYLSISGCYTVGGDNADSTDANKGGKFDVEEFEATLQAMQALGMNSKMIEAVLSIVAAVLRLGQVRFCSHSAKSGEEGSKVQADGGRGALPACCKLLKLSQRALAHALTTRPLQTRASGGKLEMYEVPQNPSQAAARRDAIAKSLYSRLFDFLVSRCNKQLHQSTADGSSRGDHTIDDELLSIGVLDIYGFEIFARNGFEQFCINYVNEKLQQIFIQLTLRAEQDEYKREGIAWEPIPFFNNATVCELIEARAPKPGIFLLLDDTCKTMHSRDGPEIDCGFSDKLAQAAHVSVHKHFCKRGADFDIKHYAGDVCYSVSGFGRANLDALGADLTLLLQGHGSGQEKAKTAQILGHLYPERIDPSDRKAASAKTAGATIRGQCASLVTALMDCNPHYVRCVKPNDDKRPLTVDTERVRHQVKYLGLVENVKVRRAGFAYRAEFHRFADRFKLLSRQTWPRDFKGADRDAAKAILRSARQRLPQLREEAQLGKRKIFIRTPETFFALEALKRRKIAGFAGRIQQRWRKFVGRKHLVVLARGIAQAYATAGKRRSRNSICRPFAGDYLRCGFASMDERGKSKERAVRADLADIIQFSSRHAKALAKARVAAASGGSGSGNSNDYGSEDDGAGDDGAKEGDKGNSTGSERVVFLDWVRKLVEDDEQTRTSTGKKVKHSDSIEAGDGDGELGSGGGSSLNLNTVTVLGTGVGLKTRLCAVTTDAVYLLQYHPPVGLGGAEADNNGGAEDNRDNAKSDDSSGNGGANGSKDVTSAGSGIGLSLSLCRRVPLYELTGAQLSLQADNLVVLRCSAHDSRGADLHRHDWDRTAAVESGPDKSMWLADRQVSHCMDTGRPFGVFRRRHHCRATGRVYCDEVTRSRAVLPDLGYLLPVRVHESVPGRLSREPVEDQALVCDRKSELVAAVQHAHEQYRVGGGGFALDGGVSGPLSGKTMRTFTIEYSDRLRLQWHSLSETSSGTRSALAVAPRHEICFREGAGARGGGQGRGAACVTVELMDEKDAAKHGGAAAAARAYELSDDGHGNGTSGSGSGSGGDSTNSDNKVIIVSVPVEVGVSAATLKARRAREKERSKRLAAEREAEASARGERQAAREAVREKERVARIAEKKRQKRRDKEKEKASRRKKGGGKRGRKERTPDSKAAAVSAGTVDASDASNAAGVHVQHHQSPLAPPGIGGLGIGGVDSELAAALARRSKSSSSGSSKSNHTKTAPAPALWSAAAVAPPAPAAASWSTVAPPSPAPQVIASWSSLPGAPSAAASAQASWGASATTPPAPPAPAPSRPAW